MDILHPRSGFSTSSKMIWYSHTHTVQFKPAQFKAVSTPSGKLSSNNSLLLIFIQSLKMRRKLVTCVPRCLSEVSPVLLRNSFRAGLSAAGPPF